MLENELKEDGVGPLTLIEFSIALGDDYSLCETEVLSSLEMDSKFEDIQVHLTAKYAGLLKVSRSEVTNSQSLGGGNKVSSSFRYVRWLHRTARNFIAEDTRWMKILSDMSPLGFSACLMLMRSSIISLSMVTGWNYKQETHEVLASFLFLSSQQMP
jgi:hypothetical protein